MAVLNTDPLVFGKPISLHVQPKSKLEPPVLSILTPSKSSDVLKVCLAAGFAPKEGVMKLTLPGNKPPIHHNISNAVLSKKGVYYFAGFSKDDIEKCQFQDKETSKPAEAASTCDPSNITNSNSSPTYEITDDPKRNTMTLIVTGLRLLLAKAVAVNVMMTIKAFLI
ncbi:uncharacterized protein LOC118242936 isoform X2 [Electrophorus electricus]|uniref:uncharacterized protein LOC118242936 isoform X2 n=1 Tax=Electrophorus electricus TaxID=8005 RepID=UPI0015D0C8D3|nr:uncharacterized protein LOC118242936 isoform X2 [Electrophorus electricus]